VEKNIEMFGSFTEPITCMNFAVGLSVLAYWHHTVDAKGLTPIPLH